MHRFFTPWPLWEEFSLSEGPQFHQIVHVFRAKKGDKVVFFEAGGDDIIYEVKEVSKKEIAFTRREVVKHRDYTASKKITVFQAYPHKVETMELIVQKLVELGISELIFFVSQYSQRDEISPQKQRRIQAIAEEALEQSGGNRPISLSYSTETIETILNKYSKMEHIIWFPGTINPISPQLSTSLWLWIWPEGWWSPQEQELFLEKKLFLWSFNEHILRLETASIVGAWLLSYLSSNVLQ